MTDLHQPKSRDWPKLVAGVYFVLTASAVIWYWATHRTGPFTPTWVTYACWISFYTACAIVLIVGLRKSAATDGMVYLYTLCAEALLPGLCGKLIDRILPGTVPHAFVEVTCHLLLTLMSSALVLCWGAILLWKGMDGSRRVAMIGRAYVLVAIIGSMAVTGWAVAWPDHFVDPQAVKNGDRIPWIWPAMDAVNMSYARIGLTILTLFLPWFRTTIESSNTQTE